VGDGHGEDGQVHKKPGAVDSVAHTTCYQLAMGPGPGGNSQQKPRRAHSACGELWRG
jgi:hypothetical protein